jgi:hypothetical protein
MSRNVSRRATVLLMVIGVLALLSIIAVVYATLGRTDRAVSSVNIQQVKYNDQADEIARYIADIIGNGTFALSVEWGTSTNGGPNGQSPLVFRRRANDYPWVDRNFVSVRIASPTDLTNILNQMNAGSNPFQAGSLDWNNTLDLFNPTGSMVRPTMDTNGDPLSPAGAPNVRSIDLRNFGTPFLMPIEPVHLRDLEGATFPLSMVPNKGTATGTDPAAPFIDRRDWLSLSNIFPSGNAINLANLRNNFYAESGWGFDAAGKPRMSQGLTLYKLGSPSNSTAAGVAFDAGKPGGIIPVEWDAMRVPRLSYQIAGTGFQAFDRKPNPLVPADWFTQQLFAARPMREEVYQPNEYSYLFNQWADADGDGIADSRWGELVDLGDFFSAAGTGAPRARSVIKTNSRMRLFVAARIIDANAMVNVNTATDTVRLPGQTIDPKFPTQNARDLTFLAGSSTAEVDLRRVLMGHDFDADYINWMSDLRTANGTLFPRMGGQSMIPNPPRAIGGFAEEPWDTLNNHLDLAPQVGTAAYLSLQKELLRGWFDQDRARYTTDPSTPANLNLVLINAPALARAREFNFTPGTVPQEFFWPYRELNLNPVSAITPLTSLMRITRAESTGGTPRGFKQNVSFTSPTQLDFTQAFDLADEIELLTYFGVNDPTVTSRLESVLGGHMPEDTDRTRDVSSMSPLRDNRPLSLELGLRLRSPIVHGNGVPGLFGNGATQYPNRELQDQVLIGMFSDIRKHLTTVNGARPLIERVVGVVDNNPAWSSGIASTPGAYALTLNSPTLTSIETPQVDINLNEVVRGLPSTPRVSGNNIVPNSVMDTAFDLTAPLSAMRSGALRGPTKSIEAKRKAGIEKVWNFYLNALLPFRNPVDVNAPYEQLWPVVGAPGTVDPNAINVSAGLSYAGNTEIAVRTAAAMTVNLADALDTDFSVQGSNSSPGARPTPNPDLHEPTAMTVFIDDQQAVKTDPALALSSALDELTFEQAYPEPIVQLPNDLNRLRVSPNLTDKTRLASSRALRVFGFEPQPFLIEVAALFLYTDSPAGAKGVPDPTGTNPTQVAIDFKPDASPGGNSDFIGEVLAFQLTNPFDDEIILFAGTSPPAPGSLLPEARNAVRNTRYQPGQLDRRHFEPRFYIRYGGKDYALVWQKPDAVEPDESRTISLLPGQTRTFYVMSPQTIKELGDRLSNGRNPAGTQVTTEEAERWLWRQLGDPSLVNTSWSLTGADRVEFENQFAPVNIIPLDNTPVAPFVPRADYGATPVPPPAPASSTQFNEYLWGGSGTKDRDNRKVATLWRVMRTVGLDMTPPGSPNSFNSTLAPPKNDLRNDLLVDRIRDPEATASNEGALFDLRDRLDHEGIKEVTGANEGTDDGLTFAFWAKFSRPAGDRETIQPTANTARSLPKYLYYPDDTRTDEPLQPRRGILPPWCVEAKSDNEFNFGSSGGSGTNNWSLNHSYSTKVDLGTYPTDYYADASAFDAADPVVSTSNNNSPARLKKLDDLIGARPKARPILKSITQSAYEKSGKEMPPSKAWRPKEVNVNTAALSSTDFEQPTWTEVAPEIHFVGFDDGVYNPLSNSGFRNLQLIKNSRIFEQHRTSRNAALFSRVGDLLLPMGVCATFDPWSARFHPSTTGPDSLLPATNQTNRWVTMPAGSDDVSAQEFQWTTIAEAIALATGYYSPAFGPSDNVNRNIYKDFGGTDMPPTVPSLVTDQPLFTPKLDRGCLRIDAFAPFRLRRQDQPNGLRDPMGTGVPFALNVLTNARLSVGVGTTQANTGAPSEVRSDIVGPPISTSEPGRINLNTMTKVSGAAASALLKPMRPIESTNNGTAVPPPNSYAPLGVPASWTTTYPLSSGDRLGALNVPIWGTNYNVPSLFGDDEIGTLDPDRVRWDMVSSIQAYRDKMTLQAGKWRKTPAPSGFSFPFSPGPTATRTVNDVNFVDASFTPPAGPNSVGGRLRHMNIASTRWDGLREQLGLRSVGELLAVNWRRVSETNNAVATQRFDPELSVQRLGIPRQLNLGTMTDYVLNHPSIVPSRYYRKAPLLNTSPAPTGSNHDNSYPEVPRAGEATQGDRTARAKIREGQTANTRETVPTLDGGSQEVDALEGPDFPNSYSGKLAIANATLNTTTVRSDVFIAYFIVQGYLPEDTIVNDDPTNGPVEPMVPSLQKRYVMVVDRSNVVKVGDRPKILFLKELPMSRH